MTETASEPLLGGGYDADTDEGVAADDGQRQRSTIRFPYGDLDDAIQVVEAMKDRLGESCAVAELAAGLGQVMTSGAFRTKVTTAQIFDVISTGRGRVTMTDLGHRVADEATRASGLAESFLRVPLYQAVYDKYLGKRLPGDSALENDMKGLGVAPKQVQRARQAFQRSAATAGYFSQGRDRLIPPPAARLKDVAAPTSTPPPQTRPTRTRPDQHPLIAGLVEELPPAGADFPAEKRQDWLEAASVIFRLVYGKDAAAPRQNDGRPDVEDAAPEEQLG